MPRRQKTTILSCLQIRAAPNNLAEYADGSVAWYLTFTLHYTDLLHGFDSYAVLSHRLMHRGSIPKCRAAAQLTRQRHCIYTGVVLLTSQCSAHQLAWVHMCIPECWLREAGP